MKRLEQRQTKHRGFEISSSFITILILYAIATNGFAAKLTMAQLASQIAEQFNANPPKPSDGFTTALKAKSVGTTVVYNYTWNYRLDTPQYKIDQLVANWRAEMIPQVCQNHHNDEAFQQGLSYTFLYFDQARRKVAQYYVDKSTCASLRQ